MTMNLIWGFRKEDQNWKSTATLLHVLCDIASKGENYLLNVGPDSHGVIPEESIKRLAEVGAWMKVNEAAIYGTTATPFSAEAGSFSPTKKDKKGQPVFKPDCSWRATQKPGPLYLIVFKWPTDGKFSVPAFAHKITGARLLADLSAKLTIAQDDKGVTVSGLPEKAPDAIASVIDLASLQAAEPATPKGLEGGSPELIAQPSEVRLQAKLTLTGGVVALKPREHFFSQTTVE